MKTFLVIVAILLTIALLLEFIFSQIDETNINAKGELSWVKRLDESFWIILYILVILVVGLLVN